MIDCFRWSKRSMQCTTTTWRATEFAPLAGARISMSAVQRSPDFRHSGRFAHSRACPRGVILAARTSSWSIFCHALFGTKTVNPEPKHRPPAGYFGAVSHQGIGCRFEPLLGAAMPFLIPYSVSQEARDYC